jgi:hypothetical protein
LHRRLLSSYRRFIRRCPFFFFSFSFLTLDHVVMNHQNHTRTNGIMRPCSLQVLFTRRRRHPLPGVVYSERSGDSVESISTAATASRTTTSPWVVDLQVPESISTAAAAAMAVTFPWSVDLRLPSRSRFRQGRLHRPTLPNLLPRRHKADRSKSGSTSRRSATAVPSGYVYRTLPHSFQRFNHLFFI